MPSTQEILARKRRLFIELIRAHFAYGANLHRNQDLFEFLSRLHGIPAELFPVSSDVMFVRFLDPLGTVNFGEGGNGTPGSFEGSSRVPNLLGDSYAHLETRFIKLVRGFDLRRLDLVTPVIVNLIFGAKALARASEDIKRESATEFASSTEVNRSSLVDPASVATVAKMLDTFEAQHGSTDFDATSLADDKSQVVDDDQGSLAPATPVTRSPSHLTISKIRRLTSPALFGDFELGSLPDPMPPPNPTEDDLVMLKTAEEEIVRIAMLPEQLPDWIKNLLVIPGISAGMALIFFDGPWIAGVLAFPLGLIPGVLVYAKDASNPLFSYLYELVVAVIVGFFSAVIVGSGAFPGLCFGTLGLSGIVWLIPGLPLVLSAMELCTQSSSAGATRLIYCIFLIILMGFGLDTGLLLANFLPLRQSPTAECRTDAIEIWWYFLLFPIVAILHCIMLEAKFPSHYFLSIPPAGIAFGLWVGLQRIEWIQKAGAGGFGMVVMLSTLGGSLPGFLYARFTHRSAFPIVYMAMQFVVPGALSMKATLSGINSPAGFIGPDFAGRVLAGVLGCTVGAFTAHILVWPVREDSKERWTFLPYR